MAKNKVTVSVIKADIGSVPGHNRVHPDLIETAKKNLQKAKGKKMLIDFYVTACGDDLELIMTHKLGVDNKKIHTLAWNTFMECTKVAKSLKLYGAGQDILSTAFSGNVRGMGPGVAEMEFVERKAEPLLVFMADKTDPGAWNYILYKIFADPFNTAGLVISTALHDGFVFEVHDLYKNQKIKLSCPEEMYDLLALIGSPSQYVVKYVFTKKGEVAASTSTTKLSLIAGKYVGKDDPVLAVRGQSEFPAVGEILEPFTFPHIVSGFMRGSHRGPLMPCSIGTAHPSRFDGPPRVTGVGFQLCNGKLVGGVDLFDDPSFDLARQKANEISDMLRLHGPFEPHRLGKEDMEYTTLPDVLKKLSKRFKKI